MGMLVEATDRIRQATRGCVTLVHHTGKDASAGMRGSSALQGAVDTVLEMRPVDGGMDLLCRKQKDDQEFAPLRLGLTVVEVSTSAGTRSTSCVVTGRRPDEPSTTGRQEEALDPIVRSMSGTGMSGTALRSVLEERMGVGRSWAYELVNALVTRSFLVNTGSKQRPFFVLKDEEESR
jgi:hypothetical protein